jgi:tetratricopeptide (TPR) repeat protein
LTAKGDLDGAIAEFRDAIRIKPDDAAAHQNLGVALRDKRQLDEAIAEYREAIRLKPDFARAHTNLGNALADKGELDRAIAEFRKAIDLDPKHALPHNNLGNALRGKKDLDGAMAEYRKAIDLDRKNAFAHYHLGLALRAKGRLDDAIAAHREAIRLKPDFAWAHCNLGNALVHQGRHKEAEAAYREAVTTYHEAIRLAPGDKRLYNDFAWLLATCTDLSVRDPGEAVRLAKKAVALAPTEGNFWNTLGVAQYRAKDWKAAIAALDKSMKLRQGGDSSDWFFLAMASWQLGEKEQARKWYHQAVQWMDKNQPQNEELRRFRAEAAALLGVKEEKI